MSAKLASCDTSVLIAALRPTQPGHLESLRAMRRVDAIAAHALVETFSVLTRLPGNERVPAEALANVLAGLDMKVLQLPAEAYLPLIQRLAGAGCTGGGVYDAQIAATAKHHDVKLLSRDRRAAAVYDLVGVDYELID